MAKIGVNILMTKLIKKIFSLISGPVSVEGVATKKDKIIKEGRELAKIDKNNVSSSFITRYDFVDSN
jgi:transaldolase